MPRKRALLKRLLLDLYLFLDELIVPLPIPGAPVLVSHREVFSKMAKQQIGYTLGTPDLPVGNDVVKLKLYYSFDGVAQPPVDMQPGGTYEIVGDIGVSIDAYFTAIDAAGNESGHGVPWDITVVDDIAPAPPGAPVVVSKRDIVIPDSPTPEPPVDPTPPSNTPTPTPPVTPNGGTPVDPTIPVAPVNPPSDTPVAPPTAPPVAPAPPSGDITPPSA